MAFDITILFKFLMCVREGDVHAVFAHGCVGLHGHM